MIKVLFTSSTKTKSNFRYNIQYGRISSSDGEVFDAARKADIHSRIETFPDGYNTQVPTYLCIFYRPS